MEAIYHIKKPIKIFVCVCVCVCLFIDIDLKEVHDRVPREAMWCIIGTHTV